MIVSHGNPLQFPPAGAAPRDAIGRCSLIGLCRDFSRLVPGNRDKGRSIATEARHTIAVSS